MQIHVLLQLQESEIPLEVLLSRYGYSFPVEKEKDEHGVGSRSFTKQKTRLKQKSHPSTITSNTTTNASTAQSATITNIPTTSSKPTNTSSPLPMLDSDLSEDIKHSFLHINHQNLVDETSKTGQASSSSLTLVSLHPPPAAPPSHLPPPLIQVVSESDELDLEQYTLGGHQLETAPPLQGSSTVAEDVMLLSSGSGVLGKHGRSHEEEEVDVDDHDAVYSDVMLACGESPISSETGR